MCRPQRVLWGNLSTVLPVKTDSGLRNGRERGFAFATVELRPGTGSPTPATLLHMSIGRIPKPSLIAAEHGARKGALLSLFFLGGE